MYNVLIHFKEHHSVAKMPMSTGDYDRPWSLSDNVCRGSDVYSWSSLFSEANVSVDLSLCRSKLLIAAYRQICSGLCPGRDKHLYERLATVIESVISTSMPSTRDRRYVAT